MQKLEPADLHRLSATVGWLELGNVTEAKAELAFIAPEQQNHPNVLEVRWLLSAREERWTKPCKSRVACSSRRPNGPRAGSIRPTPCAACPAGASGRLGRPCCPPSTNSPKSRPFPTILPVMPAKSRNSRPPASGSAAPPPSAVKKESSAWPWRTPTWSCFGKRYVGCKSQIPTSKLQRNIKPKTPSSKILPCLRTSIGSWNLGFSWDSGFGL